jgi:hypothetical protein
MIKGLGELKQQIWYNQYSISDFEKLNLLNGPANDQNDDIKSMCQNANNDSGVGLVKNGCVIVERRRISGTFWQTLDVIIFFLILKVSLYEIILSLKLIRDLIRFISYFKRI